MNARTTTEDRLPVASANNFQGTSGTVFLKDSRHEAIAQRKMQEIASGSRHIRRLAAIQRMANEHTAAQTGILALVNAAPAVTTGAVVQRTAGIVYQHEDSWVIYAKNGGHGPYTIANAAAIPAHLLQQDAEVDYTNRKNGSVWINSIGDVTFAPPVKETPVTGEEMPPSPINTDHFINNRLGLGNTDKIAGKDRHWLRGTHFNVDFGDGVGTAAVDGAALHQPLHDDSDESQGFRGNSITLSWTLHYSDAAGLKQHHFTLDKFSKFHSADFGRYTTGDLNDMYAAGRLITSHEGYTERESLGVAAARYHSERDMVVQAEKLPGFGRMIAGIVNGIIGEGIPRLLMLHVHSHKIRICDDCFQFLDAFMRADWIMDARDLTNNGEHMKITMLTSADEPHAALSGHTPNQTPEGATIGIHALPHIVNMGKLS